MKHLSFFLILPFCLACTSQPERRGDRQIAEVKSELFRLQREGGKESLCYDTVGSFLPMMYSECKVAPVFKLKKKGRTGFTRIIYKDPKRGLEDLCFNTSLLIVGPQNPKCAQAEVYDLTDASTEVNLYRADKCQCYDADNQIVDSVFCPELRDEEGSPCSVSGEIAL